MSDELICDCGTWSTFGKKVPKKSHSDWCEIRTGKKTVSKKDKPDIQESTVGEQQNFLDTLLSTNNSGGGWGDL